MRGHGWWSPPSTLAPALSSKSWLVLFIIILLSNASSACFWTLHKGIWPYWAHSQLHVQIESWMGWIGNCLIRWANAMNHGDCYFKFQNRAWDAKVGRVRSENIFLVKWSNRPPNCANDWTLNLEYILNNLVIRLLEVFDITLSYVALLRALPTPHTILACMGLGIVLSSKQLQWIMEIVGDCRFKFQKWSGDPKVLRCQSEVSLSISDLWVMT